MEFHKVTGESINFIKNASQAIQIKYFYRLHLKQRTVSQDIWFNTQCLKFNLKPNYIQLKTNSKTRAAHRTLQKATRTWLLEENHDCFLKRDSYRHHLKVLHSELAYKMRPVHFDSLNESVRQQVSEIIHQKYLRQSKKLRDLKRPPKRQVQTLRTRQIFPQSLSTQEL